MISVSQIKTLLDSSAPINITRIQDIYRDFFIYLYVWSGLSDKEVIQKMLILNAGQRKVSIGHQYELMFLQIIKDNDLIPYVKLIREKEDKYSIVKAGNRNIGDSTYSSNDKYQNKPTSLFILVPTGEIRCLTEASARKSILKGRWE